MEKYIYEGKTIEEALNLALYELNLKVEEISYEVEEKKTLFKTVYKLIITKKEDQIEDVKNLILDILGKMGLDASLEVMRAKDHIYFNAVVPEEQKAILIGKHGKNINALNTLIKQYVSNNKFDLKLNIDTAGYKKGRERKIEQLAKKLARDVVKSGMEIIMDPMNSYERRIVHQALSKNNKVETTSVGEEPNRQVLIKLKGE